MWSNFSAGSALEAVDVMVAAINEANPDINVEHTGFQNEDYKATILNTAFAGGAPPDIFASVGFEWLFAFVRPGAVSGHNGLLRSQSARPLYSWH